MVAPLLGSTRGSEHTPAEGDFSFCGCCRVPFPSMDMLTSVRLPRNVLCAGCGKPHVTHMQVCPGCLQLAESENLSDLTRQAYADSRPERRRLARFLIAAVKEQRVRN